MSNQLMNNKELVARVTELCAEVRDRISSGHAYEHEIPPIINAVNELGRLLPQVREQEPMAMLVMESAFSQVLKIVEQCSGQEEPEPIDMYLLHSYLRDLGFININRGTDYALVGCDDSRIGLQMTDGSSPFNLTFYTDENEIDSVVGSNMTDFADTDALISFVKHTMWKNPIGRKTLNTRISELHELGDELDMRSTSLNTVELIRMGIAFKIENTEAGGLIMTVTPPKMRTERYEIKPQDRLAVPACVRWASKIIDGFTSGGEKI